LEYNWNLPKLPEDVDRREATLMLEFTRNGELYGFTFFPIKRTVENMWNRTKTVTETKEIKPTRFSSKTTSTITKEMPILLYDLHIPGRDFSQRLIEHREKLLESYDQTR